MTAAKPPAKKAAPAKRSTKAPARRRAPAKPKPDPVRDAKAFALFKAAMPYEDIAAELGCSVDEARDGVARAIAASPLGLDQSSVRIVRLERLDMMHKALWPKALRGDAVAIEKVLKLDEARERALGEPARVTNALLESFDRSVADVDTTAADESLIVAGRAVARQIDHAVANGTSLEATKAMYLLPHLMNVLRELGATPAARAALRASVPTPQADPDGAPDATEGGPVDLDDWKNANRRA